MRRNTRILLVLLVVAALSFDGAALLATATDIKGSGGGALRPSLISAARALAGLRRLPWAHQGTQL